MTPELQASLLKLALREVRVAKRHGSYHLGTMKVPGGWVDVDLCEGGQFTLTQCAYLDETRRLELRALGLPFTIEDCLIPAKLILKGSLKEVALALVPLYTLG